MNVNNFKGYCITCALAGLKEPQVCPLMGIEVKSDDYCSQHRRSLVNCAICGNVILINGIIDDGHLICPNCLSHLNSCEVCRFAIECAFETDPSPIQKMTQQQVRQGNATFVTTVRNPERVRITCEKGCKCFSKEKGCLKQNNASCSNHEVSYRD